MSLLRMTMTLLWINMATVYTYDGKSVCFIGNAHQSKDATINFRNNEYTIPAWSVSILPILQKLITLQRLILRQL